MLPYNRIFPGVIKLQTLRWGGYPDYPGGFHLIRRGSKSGRGREKKSESCKTKATIVALVDGRGAWAKGCRQPLAAGKGREMNAFFPELPERKAGLLTS